MEEQYKCPWCGCEDVVYGVQADKGKVRPAKTVTFNEGQALIHVICKSCGTVLRSYVKKTRETCRVEISVFMRMINRNLKVS